MALFSQKTNIPKDKGFISSSYIRLGDEYGKLKHLYGPDGDRRGRRLNDTLKIQGQNGFVLIPLPV
jgi:hypothetical protein